MQHISGTLQSFVSFNVHQWTPAVHTRHVRNIVTVARCAEAESQQNSGTYRYGLVLLGWGRGVYRGTLIKNVMLVVVVVVIKCAPLAASYHVPISIV